MSHKVTTLVYSRKAGSGPRKAVLAYMADRASDDGSGIWASKKTIAEEIEHGRSTVIKVCKEFVSEGLLIVTGSRKCANGATVEYAINIAAVRALPSIKGSTSGTSVDRDPSTSGTPPVHQRDPKGSTSGTQTTLEPSLNQENPVIPFDDPPQNQNKRACSIPENWVPSDENIAHAVSKNLTNEEIEDEANNFRDHHLAKGTKFKDWNAGWRTWIRMSLKFRDSRMAGKQAGGRYGQGGGIAGAVARRRAGG